MISEPVPFTVPPTSLSPGCLAEGIDSPVTMDGSVATILTKDARRRWAGPDRSCGPVEQVGDKGGLAADITSVNLSSLPLPHPRHGLETRQRLPRRTETAEADPGRTRRLIRRWSC